jgi:type II secretory pathway pseudopilin PulG
MDKQEILYRDYFMRIGLMNRRGVTLVENLISIFLVSIFLVGLLSAFYISKIGSQRAEHRTAARNILNSLIEGEMRAGATVTVDGYLNETYSAQTVTFGKDPATYTITFTITPSPYPATRFTEETYGTYRTVGFIISWNEPMVAGGTTTTCREKAATNVRDF